MLATVVRSDKKPAEKKQSNKQLESDQYINILSIVRGDAVNNQYQ